MQFSSMVAQASRLWSAPAGRPCHRMNRGCWNGRGVAGLASVLLIGPLLAVAQTSRPADTQPAPNPQALMQEYQTRLDHLAPNDVRGHYALAEWCRDNKLYQPLLKESQHILRLDPAHENARLLYRLANDQIRAQMSQSRPADGGPAPGTADGEYLTPAQIQKLKWGEFLSASALPTPISARGERGTRGRGEGGVRPRAAGRLTEESLQVRYEGKVLDEFFDLMSGYQGFTSREDRSRLVRAPATLQVQMIRHHTANKFENRIEITNDPLVFRQFERVLPLVTNNCGTLACHGGPNAQVWRLRTARTRPELHLYTNFLVLTRVRRGNERLVNREKPEESLLLQFGLPPVQAPRVHPEPIPVLFPQGKDDARYRTIQGWIQTLSVPEPKTGVGLPGYPEPPPPQIGGAPKDKTEPPAAKGKMKPESQPQEKNQPPAGGP